MREGRLWPATGVLIAVAFSGVFALGVPARARAQACSFPDGGTLAGIVNSYYEGAVGTSAAASGLLTVDTGYGVQPVGATAIAAGDMLLVIQMQDATIDNSDTECYGDATNEGGGACAASTTSGIGAGSTSVVGSGLYEYVVARAAIGVASGGCTPAANQVCVVGGGGASGLVNSYTTAARDDVGGTRRGQRTYQVIRVPRYNNATLGGTLTAYAWDGRVGGVLAIDVAGTLTLGGATVSVDGLGFRGGIGQALAGARTGLQAGYRSPDADPASGRKGEGIAGTPVSWAQIPGGTGTDGVPQGDRQRGAPGNAGGGANAGDTANTENSGGGGGGNGGGGGRGGNTNATNLAIGGWGGAAFTPALNRLVPGGGGGAGSRNNNGPSSGANGGGMVFIRADVVTGTGTITARGMTGVCTENDGGGGGGAGGSIVFVAGSGAAFTAGTGPNLSGLTLISTGGAGGDANTNVGCTAGSSNAHGPGGGGGGGVVFHSDNVGAGPTVNVAGGANGVTRTPLNPTGPFIAYNATVGADGIVQTANPDNIPGVQTCLAVTRASLAGVRVEPGSVEFATQSQRSTRGFHVWAEQDGRRERLTEELVPASGPDTSEPVTYRVPVDASGASQIWIEEVETHGGSRLLGPFAVGDERHARGLERVEERALARGLRPAVRGRKERTVRSSPGVDRGPRREATASILPPRNQPGVKVDVTGSGLVRVPLADLAAQGLAAAPGELRVTHLGQPVAFQIQDGVLQFPAQAFLTDYTEKAVYVVTGPRTTFGMKAPLTRSGPPLPRGFTRVQEDVYFAPFVNRAGDPWIWDVAVGGVPAGPFSFDLPGLVAPTGGIPVRVHVSGGSDHEHVLRAEINNVLVGKTRFSGRALGVVKGWIPAGVLLENGNALRLELEGGTEGDVELVFLDAVDLGVSFSPGGPAEVARIASFDPRLAVPAATDYLIVAHADFLDAAHRIAELKAAEGYRPLVVDVERAYDRFSAGTFEAQAVRELVREVAGRARLRHVLLVGDDTFDWRDLTGEGLVSYVPSLFGWDGDFGRIPSENAFADLDGDGVPDVAIGRLPVQTAEEAEVMVDKISRQQGVLEAAAGRQLVAVDDAGAGDLSFRGRAERSLGGLLVHARWVDLRSRVEAARAALFDAWRAGPQMTHYFGHAGFDRWADEMLLGLDDLESLPQTGQETLLFTWACEAQWYQYDGGPTINEALLLLPRGGALASVGPVGISSPERQAALSELVYARLLRGETLGEAIREAKAALIRSDPSASGVAEGFALLGDPSLRLPVRPRRSPPDGLESPQR